ncbi:hypothetical protein Goshw_010904 [Gossypium schwendimanii]|uniref:Uncharacterized protein n=1 Tax=Gossypium schwendimanii TaxID=34291 RepID=A0A7J9NBI2_GOSSC|nr:hypothetical protein [Gossypium schwendimanii]
MYKWILLKTVSNIIGQVIKVDDSIDNRTRGNSAHLAISIDLRQPLILKICKEKNNEVKILFFKQPSMMELNHRAEEKAFGPWIKRKAKDQLIIDENCNPNALRREDGHVSNVQPKFLKGEASTSFPPEIKIAKRLVSTSKVLRALSESISVVSDEVETQHEEDVDVETPYNNGDMFPSLTEMDHGGLSNEINIAKVKEALDTMAPLKASARRNCSYVWRSLSTVWMDLRRSVFWQLGDGCNTKFWTDIWICELGPLIDSFIVGELAFKEASIYAMTTVTREWNWDCFENELPQNFLSCIASI